MIAEAEQANYETFRDCLSDALIQNLAVAQPKANVKHVRSGKARRSKVDSKPPGVAKVAGNKSEKAVSSSDAEELGDFIEYLASEIFPSLSEDLRTLSYSAIQNDTALASRYSLPLSTSTIETILTIIPASASDSLTLYLTPDTPSILTRPLEAYITSTTSPPPIYSTTRTSACELCARSWIPLTYHHLIPRSVHAKALRRGWAEEWELNKVAWLCRACHSFVHRVASNEELAREWDSVEKLAEREDVRAFVGWVGRVRWKRR